MAGTNGVGGEGNPTPPRVTPPAGRWAAPLPGRRWRWWGALLRGAGGGGGPARRVGLAWMQGGGQPVGAPLAAAEERRSGAVAGQRGPDTGTSRSSTGTTASRE